MEPSSKYQFKLMQCVVQINPADGRKRVQCPDHQDLMRYEKGFPPGSGGIVPLRSIPYRLYRLPYSLYAIAFIRDLVNQTEQNQSS